MYGNTKLVLMILLPILCVREKVQLWRFIDDPIHFNVFYCYLELVNFYLFKGYGDSIVNKKAFQ